MAIALCKIRRARFAVGRSGVHCAVVEINKGEPVALNSDLYSAHDLIRQPWSNSLSNPLLFRFELKPKQYFQKTASRTQSPEIQRTT